MIGWTQWKQAFDVWEQATAEYMETVLKSPLVLGPAGTMLGSFMKAKAKADNAVQTAWGNMGLPTKRDQERSLHALNQIQSRLLDMEEQLEDMRSAKSVEAG